MGIKLSPSSVARILFLTFKSICMLVVVLTVACMILALLVMLGLATHAIAGWGGVVFYIVFLIGLLFLYQP
jgi:hypothetical protein